MADLFTKLEVQTLNQAVARAAELGLLELPKNYQPQVVDWCIQEKLMQGRDGEADWILYKMRKVTTDIAAKSGATAKEVK
jgi:hypothetical protein